MERDEDTFAASGKTVYRDCINWSNNDHCAKTKANYCHPDCGDYRQLVKLVKRPETLEEIEADLRNDNRRFSNSTGVVIAQRIEAAHKRERGDCAKLREACIYALAELEHFRKRNDARLHFCDIVHVGNAKHALKAALAAPARNCDALSAQEQTEKFNQFCQSQPKCAECPLEDLPDGTGCAQAWAQLPYESAAAK